jgi:hypothetical protein
MYALLADDGSATLLTYKTLGIVREVPVLSENIEEEPKTYVPEAPNVVIA